MQHARLTIAAITVAVAAAVGVITVAAAGNSSNSNAAGGTSAGAAASPSGDRTTVQAARATVRGTTETILVDARGLPLYVYQPDTATTSRVTGQLAALWPPLLGATPADGGVTGRLTSVATTNGRQIAYNGHFLYTFVEDRPGKVTGQGVQSFFVATPDLARGAASTTQINSAKPGYGY